MRPLAEKTVEPVKSEVPGDLSSAPTADGADSGSGTPSKNAVRVARHKRRQASKGIKQINVLAPEESHDVIRALASRLRNGASATEALFDLVAHLSHSPSDLVARPARGSGPGRGPGAEELAARIQAALHNGGWKAAAIRRLLG